MEWQRRVRGARTLVAFAAVFVTSAFVPAVALAQGNPVNDLLKGVLSGGGAAAPTPAAGVPTVPPGYTPPLHGANPHGQGDVATVDLLPSNALPLPGGIDNSTEEVTVGQSRGEEVNGQYQGRVILLDENLLNVVQIGIDTQEGQPPEALNPLGPALAAICTGAGQAANCATLLNMSSNSTASGSQNSFSVATTNIGLGGVGIQTGTATSSGNISDDGTCQTATGNSSVQNANLTIPVIGGVTATLLQGSSQSTACNTGARSQSNSSTVANLQGAGLGIPVAGCANGTPDSEFALLLAGTGAATSCHADDSTAGQTSAPYGVREALAIFAVVANTPLLKVTTAGPESHAVAPPPATPSAQNPGNDGGDDGPGGGPGGEAGEGGPGGPAATNAQAGGELAFTGANVLVLALIGGALMVGGAMLARTSARRHSRATA